MFMDVLKLQLTSIKDGTLIQMTNQLLTRSSIMKKKPTITSITLGLTQTRLMFILDIPKRHNMMYLNMKKKFMYVDY